MGELMINCPICEKQFNKRKSMSNHRRVHDTKYILEYKKKMSKKWGNQEFKDKWMRSRFKIDANGKFRQNKSTIEKIGIASLGRKHSNETKQKIRLHKLGNENPAKRLDVRKRISEALKGSIPWNKGIKWNRTDFHDSIIEKIAQNLGYKGYKVLTTYGYVPDAIIIDFERKRVEAFELNPRSIIELEGRAKKKGYDNIITRKIKNDRQPNMDRKI
jgi:uncharacterized C2H2 Zn-finger protein